MLCVPLYRKGRRFSAFAAICDELNLFWRVCGQCAGREARTTAGQETGATHGVGASMMTINASAWGRRD